MPLSCKCSQEVGFKKLECISTCTHKYPPHLECAQDVGVSPEKAPLNVQWPQVAGILTAHHLRQFNKRKASELSLLGQSLIPWLLT